jgi:hypothetical protein
LDNLSRGLPPDFIKREEASRFYCALVARFELFLSYDEGDGKLIHGRPAMVKRHAEMSRRMASEEEKKKVLVGELEPFSAFSWMLNEADKKALSEWSVAVLEMMTKAEVVNSSCSGLKKKARQDDDDDVAAKAKVMKLFG